MSQEKYQEYYVPPNFINEWSVMSGTIPLRNVIEGLFLSLPFILLVRWMFASASMSTKISAYVIATILPMLISIVGVKGDSLSEFMAYYMKYKKNKRTMLYNPRVKSERYQQLVVKRDELPRDKIERMLGRFITPEMELEIFDSNAILFDDDEMLKNKLLNKNQSKLQTLTSTMFHKPKKEYANPFEDDQSEDYDDEYESEYDDDDDMDYDDDELEYDDEDDSEYDEAETVDTDDSPDDGLMVLTGL